MIGLQFIKITPDLLSTLCGIDEFKGAWAALDDHTIALNLIGDVAEHGAEFKKVLEPLKAHDLTVQIVQALHMSVSNNAQRGQLRTEAYGLPFEGGGQEFGVLDTVDPDDVPAFLEKMLAWVNVDIARTDMHPVLVVSVFVAVFLQVSPFADGNLRLARLLAVLLLLKRDYRYAGFVKLDPIMEEHAGALFAALRANQQSLEEGAPDWQQWLGCFCEVLLEQTRVLARKIEGQDGAEDLAGMPALSLAMIECLKVNKRATMKQMMAFTRGRRSTIKLRLQELLEAGMVKRHGAGRGVWYALV